MIITPHNNISKLNLKNNTAGSVSPACSPQNLKTDTISFSPRVKNTISFEGLFPRNPVLTKLDNVPEYKYASINTYQRQTLDLVRDKLEYKHPYKPIFIVTNETCKPAVLEKLFDQAHWNNNDVYKTSYENLSNINKDGKPYLNYNKLNKLFAEVDKKASKLIGSETFVLVIDHANKLLGIDDFYNKLKACQKDHGSHATFVCLLDDKVSFDEISLIDPILEDSKAKTFGVQEETYIHPDNFYDLTSSNPHIFRKGILEITKSYHPQVITDPGKLSLETISPQASGLPDSITPVFKSFLEDLLNTTTDNKDRLVIIDFNQHEGSLNDSYINTEPLAKALSHDANAAKADKNDFIPVFHFSKDFRHQPIINFDRRASELQTSTLGIVAGRSTDLLNTNWAHKKSLILVDNLTQIKGNPEDLQEILQNNPGLKIVLTTSDLEKVPNKDALLALNPKVISL